jgi:hypothetical protein
VTTADKDIPPHTTFVPDLLYAGGRFLRGVGLT